MGLHPLEPRSLFIPAASSGVFLVKQEPLNNIIRAAHHAPLAVLGGVLSLHVDSYDEAYSVPTEEAALLSLRTQQILQEETGIIDVVDPLGGAHLPWSAITRYSAAGTVDRKRGLCHRRRLPSG